MIDVYFLCLFNNLVYSSLDDSSEDSLLEQFVHVPASFTSTSVALHDEHDPAFSIVCIHY